MEINRFRSRRTLFGIVAALVILLNLSPNSAHAQKGTTSLGTDFWFAFMPNYTVAADNIRIFVASGTANKVHCDFYAGSQIPNVTQSQNMVGNDVWTIRVNSGDIAETRKTETPEFRAIHVYSENPIAVYGITNSSATTDSYLALPTPALGKEYFVSCYYDDYYYSPTEPLAGEFVVIAPFDNTVVTIHDVKSDTRSDPTGTVSKTMGTTWDVSLAKGQTYLVQSTGLHIGDQDISGTYVTSTQPIGVISGHQRCSIPIGATNNSKDHLCEMIPPLDKWGTEYFDMPMAGRPLCGDYIRLIAGDSNVTITENGKGVAVLDKPGDIVDRELITGPVVYKSNKRFLAVQHCYTEHENGDPGPGDPFSIVLTPKEQFQKVLIFRTPENYAASSYIHYATFIAPTDSVLKIMINGRPIGSYQNSGLAPIPGSVPPMSAKRVILPQIQKPYIATCGAPFGCYLYGFTEVESYGHPAGMALRIVSPDTIAPAEKRDSICGDFNVELLEVRHKIPVGKYTFEDTRISEINLIQQANDPRWSKPSFNYELAFDQTKPAFQAGDSTAFFTLRVLDKTKDAYGAVWTTDKAGNDTVYQYFYNAPKLTSNPTAPFVFDPVRVLQDSCMTVTVRNSQAKGDLQLTSAVIEGVATSGKFTVTPQSINKTLHPNDSVQLQICFTPSDTSRSYDSLIVSTECVPFKFALQGRGVTPIIYAGDIDFGAVPVGEKECKDVTIENRGNAPLVLDKNWKLTDDVHFFFSSDNMLPVTIPPGGKITVNFCYQPGTTETNTGNTAWSTNLLPPFQHSDKDTTFLRGYGIKPELNWDRADQYFVVECQDSSVIRMNLMNPKDPNNGSDITITKVDIEGPDQQDFALRSNSNGFYPLENTTPWKLANGEKVWVDVRFMPVNPKDYHQRVAQLVAHGTKSGTLYEPKVNLFADVRHSTIRITPSSFDLGTQKPGTTQTTTFWIHNDGDTVLTLNDLLNSNPLYTLTGASGGTKVKPGDSVQVTVTIKVPDGQADVNIVANGPVICTDTDRIIGTVLGTNARVAAIGHDYQDIYQCQNKTATVTTTNTAVASTDPNLPFLNYSILDSVVIQDPTNQFFFDDGSQKKVILAGIAPQETRTFTVSFTPNRKGPASAPIVYFWRDTSGGQDVDTRVPKLLTGVALHYADTLSLAKAIGDPVFSAVTNQNITVPVKMGTDFDAKSGVYGIDYTVRYRRDEFRFLDGQVQVMNGFQLDPSTGTPTVDPSDNKFEIIHVRQTSNTPIQPMDVIANINLKYVVSVDTLSALEIKDPMYLDQNGASVCWVSPELIPGAFYGTNLCGDQTIREYMRGHNPSFDVKQITPNPTKSTGRIDYAVHVGNTPMTIELFDVLGNKAMTVIDRELHQPGNYSATFDASALASGVYTVRIASAHFTESEQIVVKK